MIFNADYRIFYINTMVYLSLQVASLLFKPVQISIMLVGDRNGSNSCICVCMMIQIYVHKNFTYAVLLMPS